MTSDTDRETLIAECEALARAHRIQANGGFRPYHATEADRYERLVSALRPPLPTPPEDVAARLSADLEAMGIMPSTVGGQRLIATCQAALAAALAARTLPETEEWEYGVEYRPGYEEFESYSREHHERQVGNIRRGRGVYADTARVIRRRPAGPWEPVPSADITEEEGQ